MILRSKIPVKYIREFREFFEATTRARARARVREREAKRDRRLEVIILLIILQGNN